MKRKHTPETIAGWRIAPPRLTVSAFFVAMKYIGLPVLAAFTFLDILLFLFFQEVLGRCYGILCLF